jgi:glyoxylase-like metal-dependent hydrolase (beta-lactamase superfamily II)
MRDVFFLTTGFLRAPAAALAASLAEIRAPWTELSVTVAVVVRDDGSVVLVDAGMSEDVCANRGAHGRIGHAFFGMRTDRNDALAPQLRALGIAPDRVTTIVATHLHMDHIGGARDFPRAEVVCSVDEISAFSRRGIAYAGSDLAGIRAVRALSLEPVRRYGFAASLDLMGDGEIIVLDTRGHTMGSLAVLLRAEDKVYLHVGDAVYQRWEVDARRPSFLARSVAWNRAELLKTTALLASAELRDVELVPSHDAAVLARLPTAPKSAGDR